VASEENAINFKKDMTYHSQINLIMLATIIGLGIFLYLTPQFQSEPDPVYEVSLRDPETVQSIKIMRHDQEMVLERTAGNWHLTAPYFARANTAVVGKILNVLSANSRQRFPLGDAESFSLDSPSIELVIDDDHFAFGGVAPVTNEQYLAINGDVYLVSPRYAIWIPVSPMDLISPKLLANDEVPIEFELRTIKVTQQNGIWHVNAENKINRQPRMLESWVNQWQDCQAAELLREPSRYMDKISVVKISLENGHSIDFDVFEYESGIVFYRSEGKIGYWVSEQTGNQLLDPFFIESN